MGSEEGRGPQTDKHLPPITFTGQFFKEKTTFRVWCLYMYLVHGENYLIAISAKRST